MTSKYAIPSRTGDQLVSENVNSYMRGIKVNKFEFPKTNDELLCIMKNIMGLSASECKSIPLDDIRLNSNDYTTLKGMIGTEIHKHSDNSIQQFSTRDPIAIKSFNKQNPFMMKSYVSKSWGGKTRKYRKRNRKTRK
jgi:hypothetical protein